MKNFVQFVIFLMLFTVGNLFSTASGKNKTPKYGKTTIADMVLIYHGGAHRNLKWNIEQFTPYVVHENRQGKKEWLFDGFLFTEFLDGNGHHFAHGDETTKPARRQEWEELMEYQFEKDKGFSALNQCIAQQIKEIGRPPFKHKLVVVVPVPINEQQDWGSLDHMMDFSKPEDRIAACKWYIDRFLDRYQKEGYQLLDLEGFYWVSEKDDTFRDILVQVGDYIRSKNLKLFWIPYWTAIGFDNWKTDKFDIAYIQPNYFFKNEINYERLDAACAFGKGTNMGLEMEFDERALAATKECKRDRLISYIQSFEDNGVFREASIAYYQGGLTIYELSRSKNPLDIELMDRLAKIIIERKKMKLPQK